MQSIKTSTQSITKSQRITATVSAIDWNW